MDKLKEAKYKTLDHRKGDYLEAAHMKLVVQYIDKDGDHIVLTMLAHSFVVVQPYEKGEKLDHIIVSIEPKFNRQFCIKSDRKFYKWIVWELDFIDGKGFADVGPEWDKHKKQEN